MSSKSNSNSITKALPPNPFHNSNKEWAKSKEYRGEQMIQNQERPNSVNDARWWSEWELHWLILNLQFAEIRCLFDDWKEIRTREKNKERMQAEELESVELNVTFYLIVFVSSVVHAFERVAAVSCKTPPSNSFINNILYDVLTEYLFVSEDGGLSQISKNG
ncbi:hypothetical protein M422DRAFT_260223 [Sphaerobolus stellatus SS14]|uniref:Uncharacterized protein n=1 Tax=Sphaerobolus stellatus (strain SS14) TaxID=990650 RepID=A0A0C9UID2_SPHS4|nr:hypothetical protein M422DRAFT_274189 [Sphaerobolus stellatus SS14]KIJ37283.1 hypothetical protein M422DRAFT_260223 [Sphaerobolus stellatus SS14]